MPAGVTIKHKRKTSNFVGGELAAGEMGLNTTSGVWFFSVDGSTVTALATGGGTPMREVEIDFGSIATGEKTFQVTDAGVSPSSIILASQSGKAATGRQADEAEMDQFIVCGTALAGVVTLYAKSLTGPLSGLYRVAYAVG
jgi:hypothetical protein